MGIIILLIYIITLLFIVPSLFKSLKIRKELFREYIKRFKNKEVTVEVLVWEQQIKYGNCIDMLIYI
jgi:hypothetical protein